MFSSAQPSSEMDDPSSKVPGAFKEEPSAPQSDDAQRSSEMRRLEQEFSDLVHLMKEIEEDHNNALEIHKNFRKIIKKPGSYIGKRLPSENVKSIRSLENYIANSKQALQFLSCEASIKAKEVETSVNAQSGSRFFDYLGYIKDFIVRHVPHPTMAAAMAGKAAAWQIPRLIPDVSSSQVASDFARGAAGVAIALVCEYLTATWAQERQLKNEKPLGDLQPTAIVADMGFSAGATALVNHVKKIPFTAGDGVSYIMPAAAGVISSGKIGSWAKDAWRWCSPPSITLDPTDDGELYEKMSKKWPSPPAFNAAANASLKSRTSEQLGSVYVVTQGKRDFIVDPEDYELHSACDERFLRDQFQAFEPFSVEGTGATIADPDADLEAQNDPLSPAKAQEYMRELQDIHKGFSPDVFRGWEERLNRWVELYTQDAGVPTQADMDPSTRQTTDENLQRAIGDLKTKIEHSRDTDKNAKLADVNKVLETLRLTREDLKSDWSYKQWLTVATMASAYVGTMSAAFAVKDKGVKTLLFGSASTISQTVANLMVAKNGVEKIHVGPEKNRALYDLMNQGLIADDNLPDFDVERGAQLSYHENGGIAFKQGVVLQPDADDPNRSAIFRLCSDKAAPPSVTLMPGGENTFFVISNTDAAGKKPSSTNPIVAVDRTTKDAAGQPILDTVRRQWDENGDAFRVELNSNLHRAGVEHLRSSHPYKWLPDWLPNWAINVMFKLPPLGCEFVPISLANSASTESLSGKGNTPISAAQLRMEQEGIRSPAGPGFFHVFYGEPLTAPQLLASCLAIGNAALYPVYSKAINAHSHHTNSTHSGR